MGPLGAAKIAMIDDKFVANPTLSEMKDSNLELVVAGTSQGVLMVESEAQQLSEEKMLEAVIMGQETYKEVIDAIIKLAKKAAKEPWDIPEKMKRLKIYLLKLKKIVKKNLLKHIKFKKNKKDLNY